MHASRSRRRSSPIAHLDLTPNARRSLILLLFLSAGKAAALVVLADSLARGIVSVGSGTTASTSILTWLTGAVIARAGITWATEVVSARASLGAKEALRRQLAERVLVRGGHDVSQGVGAMTSLATRGLDDLDSYFTQYMPALVSSATVPLLIGMRILWADWVSALVIVLTILLIPIFMILIGSHTEERVRDASDSLAWLSDHLVELARGLPVLVGLGRAGEQARALRDVSERYRAKTMTTLRIAFLSSLALELIATISVAVVAVFIGVRLVHGNMGLEIGLLVLILAPECYLPFREVGAAHHASENGIEALDRARRVIVAPVSRLPLADPLVGAPSDGSLASRVAVIDLSVHFAHRERPAVSSLSFMAERGEIVALTGASGEGKSTVLAAIAGLIGDTREEPGKDGDGIRVTGTISGVDRERLAWVSQHPTTYAGTVREEIQLACGTGREDGVISLLQRVRADHLAERHPGELSPGELRRVAMARALARVEAGASLLLLDEPTAHLDRDTASDIERVIEDLRGKVTIVMVAHDRQLRQIADMLVPVGPQVDDAPDQDWLPGRSDDARRTVFSAGESVRLLATDNRPAFGRNETVQRHDTRTTGNEYRQTANASFATGENNEETLPAVPGAYSAITASPTAPAPATSPSTRDAINILVKIVQPWRARFLLAVVFGVLASLAAVALTSISGWLIVRASQQPPILYLLVAIVGVRFFGIGRALFRYCERLWLHDAIFASLTDTRVRVWAALAAQGTSVRRMLRGEEMLDHLIGDVDRMRDLAPRVVLPPIVGVLTAIASIVAMGLLLPSAAPVMIACTVMAIGIAPLAAVWADRSASAGELLIRSDVLRRLAALFGAAADLRANGMDGTVLDRIGKLGAHASAVARRSSWALGLGNGMVTLTCGLTSIAMLAVASPAMKEGTISPELVAVLVLTPLALIDPFLGTVTAVQQWPSLRTVLSRFSGVMEVPAVQAERNDGEKSLDLARDDEREARKGSRRDSHGEPEAATGGPSAPRAEGPFLPSPRPEHPFLPSSRPERSAVERSLDCAPVRSPARCREGGYGSRRKTGQYEGARTTGQSGPIGELSFENLAASWPGRSERVFANLDLEIGRGQWLTVTGPSGTGKSTLLAVLLGFLRPTDGTYLLNGEDTATMPGDVIRRHIAWCPQEAHLFDSSLRANLLLARSREDAPSVDELHAALDRLGLSGMVADLPDGLETRIGSQGSFLSGGQRQRVAVARTLLTDADVLLIDEPTAHLDRESAEALMRDLRIGLSDKIVVMVTHDQDDIDPGDLRLTLGGEARESEYAGAAVGAGAARIAVH